LLGFDGGIEPLRLARIDDVGRRSVVLRVLARWEACVMPTDALTKNSTNGASFVACRSVDPAITAMASAMEGKAGSSAGVFGTSCVRTRALLPLPSTVPSFSARPIFDKVSGYHLIVRRGTHS
jgi:hypothetical protein